LKKQPRFDLEQKNQIDNQIFGFEFTRKEVNRALRFMEQYPDTNPLFPLIERNLNKNECAWILKKAGIKQPAMYDLGFNNNNCIGCVKGGAGYWNLIKKYFPVEFERMAKAERKAGHSCIKNKFLDELQPDEGMKIKPITADCGIFCQIEAEIIEHKNLEFILNGNISIYDTV